MSRPVVVTGATGNVGRAVVETLRARGVPLRAAARAPEEIARQFGPDVPAVALDFSRPETFGPAVEGARGLFLLRPPAVANVGETLNVLADRAAAAGVEQVVFLSVAGADTQRWVPHHKVEQHLFAGPMAWTILRPGFFAQNLGDAYRADIRDRSEIVVPAGHGRVAFVDVRDVGEVAARAFDEPTWRGQAYWLTGPEAVTFDDVVALLGEALGRPIRYIPASVPRYAVHLRQAGMPWVQVAVQTYLHFGLRSGAAATVDPTLGRLLGRAPRTMRDYVRDHLALWR